MLIAHALYCSLSLLIQLDKLDATNYPAGSGSTPPISGTPPADGDFLLLLISAGLLTLTVFFLYQAASIQRWMTKGEEDAPNPDAGLNLAWGIVSGVIMLWCMYIYIKEAKYYVKPNLVGYFMDNPKRLAPALLLSSCMIGFLTLFRFAMVWSFFRSSSVEPSKSPRSPATAIVSFVFSAVSLAASIATLVQFFKLT
jgi:hypothetical protein